MRLSDKLMLIYKTLRNRFGFLNWWPADTPFEVVVGTILTQNVAWTNVEKSIYNLKNANLLSLEGILNAPPSEVKRCIAPSGYYNVKYRRLISLLSFLRDELKGNIKNIKKYGLRLAREKLLSVNGVGRETADSILLYAVGLSTFVIDAYTKRSFYRIGILKTADIDYDEVQKIFLDNLKRDIRLYNDYHAQIVELGKNFCRKKPVCPDCPLTRICKKLGVH